MPLVRPIYAEVDRKSIPETTPKFAGAYTTGIALGMYEPS